MAPKVAIFVLFKPKGTKHFLKGTDVFRHLSPTCVTLEINRIFNSRDRPRELRVFFWRFVRTGFLGFGAFEIRTSVWFRLKTHIWKMLIRSSVRKSPGSGFSEVFGLEGSKERALERTEEKQILSQRVFLGAEVSHGPRRVPSRWRSWRKGNWRQSSTHFISCDTHLIPVC